MLFKFTKMHGLGNDYIYINCLERALNLPEEFSLKYSDRHFGIGADGLVLICPSTQADFRMRMFNADGSEAEMCGNAIRCVGKYVYDRGLTSATEITVETGAGVQKECPCSFVKCCFSLRYNFASSIVSNKWTTRTADLQSLSAN